jgi:hypothetical protein
MNCDARVRDDGADVDDEPAAARCHVWERGLSDAQCAVGVCVEGRLDVVQRLFTALL